MPSEANQSAAETLQTQGTSESHRRKTPRDRNMLTKDPRRKKPKGSRGTAQTPVTTRPDTILAEEQTQTQ